MLMKTSIFLFVFLFGGTAYVLLELIWRRRSHVSMFFAGGFCFMLLFALFGKVDMPLLFKCIAGGTVITAVEFLTGALVNIRMKLNVWDYLGLPLNLYGQISLPFSLGWCLLSLPISFLCDYFLSFA